MRSPYSLVVLIALIGCGGGLTDRPPAPAERTPAPIVAPRSAVLRLPVVAGSWYPGDAAALTKSIDGYLAAPRAKLTGGPVRALIVPHAGYAFSGPTAGVAFSQIKGARYHRVIVVGPAHDVAFEGAGIEQVTHYRTPLGDVPIDVAAADALLRASSFSEQTAAGAKEHSIEMEIPFLQRALPAGFELLPILIGDVDEKSAKAVADAIRPYADEGTLVVASGDFTHYGESYGFVPFPRGEHLRASLEGLDLGFFKAVERLAPAEIIAYRDRTKIDSCGEGAFLVLSELLSPDVRGKLLHYETSGMQNGDYSSSVGYVAAAFSGPRSPKDAARALARVEMTKLHTIAKLAVDAAVRGPGADHHRFEAVGGGDARLRENGAAFVTLEKKGELRGCVGTLTAAEPLWLTVAKYAAMAATEDDRFPRVRSDELADLSVEVSVLSPMIGVAGPEALRLGADGAVLELDGHRAVFLPEVATEQGWDRETWLGELSLKAGLDRFAWRRGARFEAFTSQRVPFDDD